LANALNMHIFVIRNWRRWAFGEALGQVSAKHFFPPQLVGGRGSCWPGNTNIQHPTSYNQLRHVVSQ